jgi:hypothetical protein
MVATFIEAAGSGEDAEIARPSWAEIQGVLALAVRTRLGGAGAVPRARAWGEGVRVFALGAVLIQAIFATIVLWDVAHGYIFASAAQRRAWTATSGPADTVAGAGGMDRAVPSRRPGPVAASALVRAGRRHPGRLRPGGPARTARGYPGCRRRGGRAGRAARRGGHRRLPPGRGAGPAHRAAGRAARRGDPDRAVDPPRRAGRAGLAGHTGPARDLLLAAPGGHRRLRDHAQGHRQAAGARLDAGPRAAGRPGPRRAGPGGWPSTSASSRAPRRTGGTRRPRSPRSRPPSSARPRWRC